MRFFGLLLLVLPLAFAAAHPLAASCVTQRPGEQCHCNPTTTPPPCSRTSRSDRPNGCCGRLKHEIETLNTTIVAAETKITNELTVLTTKVQSEEGSVRRLFVAVKKESSARSKADKALSRAESQVSKALKVETHYRIDNDTLLLAALRKESSKRSHADKKLSTRLSTISKALHHEQSQREEHNRKMLIELDQEAIYQIENDTVLEKHIERVAAAINAERKSRKSHDASILKLVKTESTRRSRKDKSLSRSIARVSKALKLEIQYRVDNDTALRAALHQETSRRLAGDKHLQHELTQIDEALKADIKHRQSEDEKLEKRITIEGPLRQGNDTLIYNELVLVNKTILAEIPLRVAGDKKLKDEISQESRSRKSHDATLQSEINRLKLARCDAFTSIFLSSYFPTDSVEFPAVPRRHVITNYAACLTCEFRVGPGAVNASYNVITARPKVFKFQNAADYVELIDEKTNTVLKTFKGEVTPCSLKNLAFTVPTTDAFVVRFVSSCDSKPVTNAGFDINFALSHKATHPGSHSRSHQSRSGAPCGGNNNGPCAHTTAAPPCHNGPQH